jgi:hypothetical protein
LLEIFLGFTTFSSTERKEITSSKLKNKIRLRRLEIERLFLFELSFF